MHSRHSFNPNAWEAEAGRSADSRPGQFTQNDYPQQYSETLVPKIHMDGWIDKQTNKQIGDR